MAVKEGRAITKANRDGSNIQPRGAGRPEGVAVIGSMGWVRRQRRDHISERPKRAARKRQAPALSPMRPRQIMQCRQQAGAAWQFFVHHLGAHRMGDDTLRPRRARLLDMAHGLAAPLSLMPQC